MVIFGEQQLFAEMLRDGFPLSNGLENDRGVDLFSDGNDALGSWGQSLQKALRDISAVLDAFDRLKLERLFGPVDINGNDVEGPPEYFSADGMRLANEVDRRMIQEIGEAP